MFFLNLEDCDNQMMIILKIKLSCYDYLLCELYQLNLDV